MWFMGQLTCEGGVGVGLSIRADVIVNCLCTEKYWKEEEKGGKTSKVKSCLVSENKTSGETVNLHQLPVSDLFLLQLSPIARLSMRNDS